MSDAANPANDEFTHAYVGFRKDGKVAMLTADDGSKTTAREVARILRAGGRVERMTTDDARQTFIDGCARWAKHPESTR